MFIMRLNAPFQVISRLDKNLEFIDYWKILTQNSSCVEFYYFFHCHTPCEKKALTDGKCELRSCVSSEIGHDTS